MINGDRNKSHRLSIGWKILRQREQKEEVEEEEEEEIIIKFLFYFYFRLKLCQRNSTSEIFRRQLVQLN